MLGFLSSDTGFSRAELIISLCHISTHNLLLSEKPAGLVVMKLHNSGSGLVSSNFEYLNETFKPEECAVHAVPLISMLTDICSLHRNKKLTLLLSSSLLSSLFMDKGMDELKFNALLKNLQLSSIALFCVSGTRSTLIPAPPLCRLPPFALLALKAMHQIVSYEFIQVAQRVLPVSVLKFDKTHSVTNSTCEISIEVLFEGETAKYVLHSDILSSSSLSCCGTSKILAD
jgi:hypothetical protein